MGNKPGKVSSKDIQNIAETTEFSKTEVKVWLRKFKKDYPSGCINQEEFKELYGTFFPDGDTDQFAEHTFRVYDKNGDGTIDFREFLTALSLTTRGSVDDKLKWLFALYDRDGNGFISKHEMLEITVAVCNMVSCGREVSHDDLSPEERVEKIYEKLDRNSDENLSLEEFIEGVKYDNSVAFMLHTNQMGLI